MSQQQTSEKKNRSFFLDHHEDYKRKVSSLETYQNIFREVSAAVTNAELLVDIGNGGVFDYETDNVKKIVAVDLMFTPEFDRTALPRNAEAVLGSALDLPFANGYADVALMNMLLHHLTGRDVESSRRNMERSIAEAFRILRSGGKIVIMESCVPHWFFQFEQVVYQASVRVIERLIDHPSTLQFPPDLIASLLQRTFADVTVQRVPKGRWVLQYGKLWPSVLTPVQPHLFLAKKR
jgi:SAM-dependent methyltransferase